LREQVLDVRLKRFCSMHKDDLECPALAKAFDDSGGYFVINTNSTDTQKKIN